MWITYIRIYDMDGGGLPELHTFASTSRKTICLLDGAYKIYKWIEPAGGCQGTIEYWQFSEQHYRVLARKDNGFRWRCSSPSAVYGMPDDEMRGGAGSPTRSSRADKDNKEKKHKKNRVELKEAKEVPPQYEAPPVPREDPRPPLQRKRKMADDRPPLERKRRNVPATHNVDPGNMGDPSRIQMLASTSPPGTQCKTQASSSSSSVPCPLTALLKKADEEADDKFKDRPEAVLGLLQMREGHYFCILCRKWVTDLHLKSSHHMKQLTWYQKMCPQERIPELAKLMKYVHEYFKQREEEAGVEARGGMPSGSGSLPAKAEVKQKGDGTDGVPGGEGGVDPQGGHGSSSGSAGSGAAVERGDSEGVLRDERGRAVLILSSKFTIRFSVCKHTLTNAVFVALSYVMNIHSSKVVLLCKGERVVWDIEVTTAAERGWSWIATSAPLSSPAHMYRLQPKHPVEMPMQELECDACLMGKTSEEDEGMTDQELRMWLQSKAVPSNLEEQKMMEAEDKNTSQALLLMGKDYVHMSWGGEVLVQTYLNAYAKTKKVRRGRLRIFRQLGEEDLLEEGCRYTIARRIGEARGGAKKWCTFHIEAKRPGST